MLSIEQRNSERIISIILNIANFIFTDLLPFELKGNIDKRKYPYLIIANHISFNDPPLLGFVLSRVFGKYNTYFIAKNELFASNKYFAKLLNCLQAIPVNRMGVDMLTIQKALKVLENGDNLVIFPEGTRNKTHRFLKPRAGAGYIALKSRVYILPIYIKNTNAGFWNLLMRKKKLIIIIGEPFRFKNIKPNSKNSKILAKIMIKEIGALKRHV